MRVARGSDEAMPIYEYVCDNCSEAFERIVRRSDQEIDCPKCGGFAVTRQVSAFAFKSGSKFTSSSAKANSCSGCGSSGSCSGHCG